MTAPAVPLEKAIREAEVAIESHSHLWPKGSTCQHCSALRALLAALDADLPRLLAVAKAAVEVVDADEGEDWSRMFDARLALRAAVRGDEGGEG